jgi:hypothetical protein
VKKTNNVWKQTDSNYDVEYLITVQSIKLASENFRDAPTDSELTLQVLNDGTSIVEITISPETIWTGFAKIGGIMSIAGLLTVLALWINQRVFQAHLMN